MTKKLLGVKIDDVSRQEALSKVTSWLEKGNSFSRPKLVVTPGPEFLLTAQKDTEFKKLLNSADLSLPDGFGLNLYGGVKNRVPGTDFMTELCRVSEKKNWTVGLMGGDYPGVAKKTAENMRGLFPGIRILYALDGREADQVLRHYEIVSTTKQSFDGFLKLPRVDLLFVAFGHPKQEKLLEKMKADRMKLFKVGMGVGGAFDYISGEVSRPNKLFRSLGFEWLGRLLNQPFRFQRTFRATIVFPIMLFLDRGKVRS